ncbi:MAG: threonine--tRNA ligase [Gammaproteobacteria bacterium]|nr:MAG: threonine--tRNA ligase [Pseudomonadota bacterium]MBC6944012.1 threonine--tRNA ligase [Gammaproteobacteria bacterium]MCE7895184.1 threonine--tRNA ligase [Gammaproteobacteria bacterium PRO8]MDL1880330.1 threonine--tRNA ligase [Gammaproteobacteria bacterium PRO2]MCL4776048.1 threonine--tRNA ligase [Gammaproteobacteria bacterium]
MPVVTLPDGSTRSFDHPVTVAEVAAAIGPGLARAALAGRVGDRLVDTSFRIEADTSLAIVTDRDADGLEVIRHSTAHLLAQAVKALFPTAQVTIGPVIEDGFYYDFAFERPFTPEDIAAIEAKMKELAKADLPVSRRVLPRDQAVKVFSDLGEKYKAEIIAGIPAGEEIGLYGQGDWFDLCRGPHVPSTGKLRAFKLMKVAGAYWRGDSRNEMLQRIYGTAWPDEKSLKDYLHRLEEAEKRDHRRIGRELDLFHFQEEAPGAVFWHPKGWTLFQQLIGYMRERQREAGYVEVNTPEIMDRSLWVQSGHVEKFGENMFMTQTPDERVYAIKPMNCPGHIQVFNQGLKSYRDLPLRICEFGKVHRYEPSGALHGLMRVRAFTQDDAHVFCTEEQITAESVAITQLILGIYRDFGFEDIRIKFSDRPEKRVGSDAIWDRAEAALLAAAEAAGLEMSRNPGEGAFYGPKLEFVLRDAIGRDWQCGTLQVDFNLPGRLGASYVADDSQRRVPVMLHRAMFGSLERFCGILLEHHAGRLPSWLAPVQAVVLNITDRQAAYAGSVKEVLENQGFRVALDLRNEKIGFKIREHTLQRVPYLLVTGDREAETKTVAVRTRNGKDLGTMSLEALSRHLGSEVASRGRVAMED